MRASSKLSVGEGSIVEGSLISEREGSEIIIGANTFIGESLIASANRIEIGDDVLIAWGCNIVDHNSHSIVWRDRQMDVRNWYVGRKDWSHVITKPVRIGDKCWIGFNVAILKGVQIGEGAVIGAGSVVTKDVSPWTVVVGNPARMVREISVEDR
jgi:acetyltransferase-like isoleucine patch superfamily enzyme